jgi:hypothetical protein
MSANDLIPIIGLIILILFGLNAVINTARDHVQSRPYRDIHNFSQRAQKDIDRATRDFIDKMK